MYVIMALREQRDILIIDANTKLTYQGQSLHSILKSDNVSPKDVEPIIKLLIENGYVMELVAGTLLFHSNQVLCENKFYSESFMDPLNINAINYRGRTNRVFFALNVAGTLGIYGHIIKGLHIYVLKKDVRIILYPLIKMGSSYLSLKVVANQIFDIDQEEVPKILNKNNLQGIISIDMVDLKKSINDFEKNLCCNLEEGYACHDIALIGENLLFRNIVKIHQFDLLDPMKMSDDVVDYQALKKNLQIYFAKHHSIEALNNALYPIFNELIDQYVGYNWLPEDIRKQMDDNMKFINNSIAKINYKDLISFHFCFNLKIIKGKVQIPPTPDPQIDVGQLISSVRKVYQFASQDERVLLLMFSYYLIPGFTKMSVVLLQHFLYNLKQRKTTVIKNLENFYNNEITNQKLTTSVLLYGLAYFIYRYYQEMLNSDPNHFQAYVDKNYQHRNKYASILNKSLLDDEDLYRIVYNSMMLLLQKRHQLISMDPSKQLCPSSQVTYNKLSDQVMNQLMERNLEYKIFPYFNLIAYFKFIYDKNSVSILKLIDSTIASGSIKDSLMLKSFYKTHLTSDGAYSYFSYQLRKTYLWSIFQNGGRRKIENNIPLRPLVVTPLSTEQIEESFLPSEKTLLSFERPAFLEKPLTKPLTKPFLTKPFLTKPFEKAVATMDLAQKIIENYQYAQSLEGFPSISRKQLDDQEVERLKLIMPRIDSMIMNENQYIFITHFKDIYEAYLYFLFLEKSYDHLSPLLYDVLQNPGKIAEHRQNLSSIIEQLAPSADLKMKITLFQQVFPYLNNLAIKFYQLSDFLTEVDEIDHPEFWGNLVEIFDLYMHDNIYQPGFTNLIKKAIVGFNDLVESYFGENYSFRVVTLLLKSNEYDFQLSRLKFELQQQLLPQNN